MRDGHRAPLWGLAMLVLAGCSGASEAPPTAVGLADVGGIPDATIALVDMAVAPDPGEPAEDTAEDDTPPDGVAADPGPPPDAGPICGDGACWPDEDCLEDCRVVDGCGDMVCAADEDAAGCPLDCAGGPAAGCLRAQCLEPMAGCAGFGPCAAVLACLLGCGDDGCAEACMGAGSEQAVERLQVALQCGNHAGCFAQPDGCGDGICQGAESVHTCPRDCLGSTECLVAGCAEPLAGCEASDGCLALRACLQGCTDGACATLCYQAASPLGIAGMQGLVACALAEGCATDGPVCGDGQCAFPAEDALSCPADCPGTGGYCGDGDCGGGETAAGCPADCGGGGDGTCEGKCGQFDQNAKCQCDPQCKEYSDCCADFEKLCGGA